MARSQITLDSALDLVWQVRCDVWVGLETAAAVLLAELVSPMHHVPSGIIGERLLEQLPKRAPIKPSAFDVSKEECSVMISTQMKCCNASGAT